MAFSINHLDLSNIHLFIKEVFSDSYFEEFLIYCEENNFIFLSELSIQDIKNFKSLKNINNTKFHKIYAKMESYNNKISFQKEFNALMDADLELLTLKDLPKMKVKDFFCLSLQELKNLDLEDKDIHDMFILILEVMPLEKIFSLIENKIKSLHREILSARFEKNMTLETIGFEVGISKERVRQIEKTTIDKIYKLLYENHFLISLKITSPKIGYFEKDFKDLIGEKNSYLVEILKAKDFSDEFYFLERFNYFFFKNEYLSKESYLEMLQAMPKSPKFYFGEDMRNDLKYFYKKYPWFTDKMGISLAKSFGYQYKNGYFFKNLNHKEMVELFFKDFVHSPKIVTDHTAKQIILEIAEIFDQDFIPVLETGDSALYSSLKAVIYRIPEVITVGISKFLHISKLDYDYDELKNFKDMIFEEYDEHLDIRYIFKKYRERCRGFGGYNEHILYSLLKYHFYDEFNYNKNTYILSKKDRVDMENLKLDRVEIIENYIREVGKPILKYDLSDALSYRIENINSAIEKSKSLIMMDLNEIGLIEFIKISEEKEDIIKKLVGKLKEDGFIAVSSVLTNMKKLPELKGFFEKNSVNKYFLSSYIKHIFPHLKGNANILFEGEPSVKNLSDFALLHFQKDEGFELKTLNLFLKENGASQAGIRKIVSNLIENGKIDKINECNYRVMRSL